MLVNVCDQPSSEPTGASWRTWRFANWVHHYAWNYRLYIWLAIAAFYLLSFNGLWRATPDSALYLSVARNIARGEGYTHLGEAHRLAYPGIPYLVAGMMKLFGEHAIAVSLALIVAMALAALAVCYRLFRIIVSPGVAVIATLAVSVNYKLYALSFSILTDVPFLLGSLLVLLGAAWSGLAPAPRVADDAAEITRRQKRLGWVLMSIGLPLCAVMRPTFYALAGGLLLAAVIQIIRTRTLKRGIAVGAVVMFIALVMGALLQADPRRAVSTSDVYEQAIFWHFRFAIDDPTIALRNIWNIITPELPTAFFAFSWSPFLDPIACVLVIGATAWTLWRWPLAMLWIAGTLLPQVLVDPEPRYMLPIIPLLTVSWWHSATRISTHLGQHTANTITIAAFLTFSPHVGRDIGQVWAEQYRRPFMAYYEGGRMQAVDEVAQAIRERVPPDAVVIAPDKSSQILTWLTDRWCIPPRHPIPPHMLGRPVWIVFSKDDPEWRQTLEPFVKVGRKEMQTTADYRKMGPLVLRKASWNQGEQ